MSDWTDDLQEENEQLRTRVESYKSVAVQWHEFYCPAGKWEDCENCQAMIQ